MRTFLSFSFLFLFTCQALFANYVVKSPDNRLELIVNKDGKTFSFGTVDRQFVKQANIDLIFNSKSVYANQKVRRVSKKKNFFETVQYVPYKNSKFSTASNSIVIEYNNKNAIEFQVFNDGFAYRYITKKNTVVEVNEKAEIEFSEDMKMWASPISIETFGNSYEVPYEEVNINAFSTEKQTYLPLLLGNGSGHKMLLTDVNVFDYPNSFFRKSLSKKNTLEAFYPPFPLETELIGDRKSKIKKGADYIAKTNGNRNFPWRLFVFAETDAGLVQSNLTYVLAEDKRFDDLSWIKPGRVAWDWWNSVNLKGVDFESGFNTDTYKYYIDFASKYGLEYVILDEGWSVSTTDISQPRSDLNLFELIRYAKSKNVDLILWASWRAIESQFFVLERYSQWGIKGIKVDFMDRADQWMVNFYERVAAEGAKHKLLVNFHGAYKPTGLQRTFPNVINFEGVCGLEQNKWSKDRNTPKHNLTIPFIRMVTGPMDYTPVAMRNFHQKEYSFNFHRPGSMTTRAHEVATFVVFEGPLQMLADSPTNYEGEEATTKFLSLLPTTWDELKVLKAEIGSCLVLARRKGDNWYVAGLNNNDMSREFTLDLSFITKNNSVAKIFKDGINTHRHAEDFTVEEKKLTADKTMKLKMAAGGGFVIII